MKRLSVILKKMTKKKKDKTVLDPETGLLRIIALKNFSDVKKGDFGGLIEKEDNLSQEGNCWVSGGAWVSGNACVYENARILGFAHISENACIGGNAKVYGQAHVYGNAKVYEDAVVCGHAVVYEDARVFGNVRVYEGAEVYGRAKLWSTDFSSIHTSVEDNKEDYIVLGNKKEFYIYSSNIIDSTNFTTATLDYIKNIKTIRQLYGKEI